MRVERVMIEGIIIPEDRKNFDANTVESLSKSMKEIGLIHPIHLAVKTGQNPTLVAGRKRLAAAKKLQWEEIDAIYIDNNEEIAPLFMELVEIDENLIRKNNSAAEMTDLLTRRKRIWEQYELAKGGLTPEDLYRGGRGRTGFTTQTAKTLGRSRQNIDTILRRGESLAPGVLKKVRGTSLDKESELRALSDLPAEKQIELADQAAAGEKVTARAPRKTKALDEPTPVETEKQAVQTLSPPPDNSPLPFEEDEQFLALTTAWDNASASVRERFLLALKASGENF